MEERDAGTAIGTNADGRLEVFVTYGTGLYHTSQLGPGIDNWTGLRHLGKSYESAAVARNPHGQLEVFAITHNLLGTMSHVWQTAPNGDWSGWLDFPDHGFGPPGSVVQTADGRIELFSRGVRNKAWHIWQEPE